MERQYVLLAIVTLKSVRRNMFNNSIANGNAYSKTFSGAKVGHLDNFIESTLSKDKSEMVILHIGSNEIADSNMEDIKISTIVDVISIDKKCVMFSVKDIVIHFF